MEGLFGITARTELRERLARDIEDFASWGPDAMCELLDEVEYATSDHPACVWCGSTRDMVWMPVGRSQIPTWVCSDGRCSEAPDHD